MTHNSKLAVSIGVPLIIILISVVMGIGPWIKINPNIAIGITFDLALTAPLVYFFMIRKSDIPKITVVPVFILGVIVASILLKSNQQYHLNLIKTYLLPGVELGVFISIIYNIRQTIKAFKADTGKCQDFYSILRDGVVKVIGFSTIANVFATEIALVYYAFISWKEKAKTLDQFSVHKESGNLPLFAAFIFVLMAETFVLHILLVKWNTALAWFFTMSSLYVALQIFGHIKAMRLRFAEIDDQTLFLRYGMFGDVALDLNKIMRIELITKEVESNELIVEKLALFKTIENHNVAIHCSEKILVKKPYGLSKTCDVLIFHIDDKERFVDRINFYAKRAS